MSDVSETNFVQRVLKGISKAFKRKHSSAEYDPERWDGRIATVLACPDNARIPRHPQAGEVVDGALIMHNGIKVDPLCYYGGGMLEMLRRNKGVHEPQEEVAFAEIL